MSVAALSALFSFVLLPRKKRRPRLYGDTMLHWSFRLHRPPQKLPFHGPAALPLLSLALLPLLSLALLAFLPLALLAFLPLALLAFLPLALLSECISTCAHEDRENMD